MKIIAIIWNNRDYFLCEVCENGERKSYRFFISHHARRALRCLRALSVYKQYTCTARSNRCDLGRDFFCLCGDTRKKIVAIQIALFSACVDTRKNSRDLNRDSNRAFLVCGNAPMVVHFRKKLTLFLRCPCSQFQEETYFVFKMPV